MRFLPFFILFLCACGTSGPDVETETPKETKQSQHDCISWFHECNCTHVCTTESAYNARMENGEGNCDVFCEPGVADNVPTESCEEVDGICQFTHE